MNKAELYARYDNFGKDLIEVPTEEFYSVMDGSPLALRNWNRDGVYCMLVSIDGWDYLYYCVTHNVGWQGDVDAHSFYCKKETITAAYMKEMEKLFCSL